MLLPGNWIDCDLADIALIAPLQKVELPVLAQRNVTLLIKREDLLHPLLGGNKLYKLHGYLRDYVARQQNVPIATFGGAFSNHIVALAVAGHMCGMATLGVIRGERPSQLSPTLVDAQRYGMRLHFVSRSEYRSRQQSDFIRALEASLGPAYWVPEGGAGELGALGMASLTEGLASLQADAVLHACGTGSSLAGLVAGFASQGHCSTKIFGVAALKNSALQQDVAKQLNSVPQLRQNWQLLSDYHFGGYAKFPSVLREFVAGFEAQTGIPLDPVYTSKMTYAAIDLAKNGVFEEGAKVVLIHSGGLQGRRGFGLEFNQEILPR